MTDPRLPAIEAIAEAAHALDLGGYYGYAEHILDRLPTHGLTVVQTTDRALLERRAETADAVAAAAKLLLERRTATLRARAERAEALLREVTQTDPCQYDHHGNCQAHDLGNPCAHGRAQELLATLGHED